MIQILKQMIDKKLSSRICTQAFTIFKKYQGEETAPEPTLFFLTFIYSQLHMENDGNFPIFILGILLLLGFRINVLYFLPIQIGTTNWESIIQIILSLLSCNRKFKIMLFGFSIISSNFSGISGFIAVFLGSLYCEYQIYKYLIFPTVKENKEYFTGFFAIATAYLTLTAAELLAIRIPLAFVALIALLSLSSGRSLIQQRIQRLREEGTSGLKDPHLTALCLSLLREDLKDPKLAVVQLKRHRRECLRPECFCREEGSGERADLLLRQTFRDVRARFEGSDDPLLCESFVGHLLGDEQTINALHCLSRWRPGSFFSWTALLRSEARLVAALDNEDSSNGYEEEYRLALSYDALCLELAKGIHEVLGLKVRFWEEAAREEPRLAVLQRAGLEAVEKMHELNRLYGLDVRRHEESIYSFDATALYVAFLLSATSFKEYASQILQRTAKIVRQQTNLSCETFAIRTCVKSIKDTFISDNYRLPNFKKKVVSSAICNNVENQSFKLIIDQISCGVSQMLEESPQQLIGRELLTIIPSGYKELHSYKVNQMLNFHIEKVSQLHKPIVFHRELPLPMKSRLNKLYIEFVCIKFHVDITMGPCFVSIIKKVPKKHVTALLNFMGQVTQIQSEFPRQVLQHPQVKRYLSEIKKQWSMEKIIREEKINIMIDSLSYGVTIGSPYFFAFLDMEELSICLPPPIHVDVCSDSILKMLEGDKGMIQNVRKTQNVLNNEQNYQQSVMSSQKQTSSTHSILQKYIEQNYVPLYRYLLLLFLVIVLITLSASVIMFKLPILEWDNTKRFQNPIQNYIHWNDAFSSTIRGGLLTYDKKFYQNYSSLMNISRIENYYSNYETYDQSSKNMFKYLQNEQTVAINQILTQSLPKVQNSVQNILSETLPLINSNTRTIINPSQYNFTRINVTYLEILMMEKVQYNSLTKENQFSQLFINQNRFIVYEFLNKDKVTHLKNIIQNIISESIRKYHIIGLALTLSLFILVLPLFLLLQKRYHQHQIVYHHIMSVEKQDIFKQISSLSSVQNLALNFYEEKENMKIAFFNQKKQSSQVNVYNETRCFQNKRNKQNRYVEQRKKDQQILDSDEDSMKENRKSKLLTKMKRKISNKQVKSIESSKRNLSCELNVKSSEYDSRKIHAKHVILLILIVFFILFLGGSLLFTISYQTQIKQSFQKIVILEQETSKSDRIILKLKMLFSDFGLSYIKYLERFNRLNNQIKEIENVSIFSTYNSKQTQILSMCQNGTINLVCQDILSLRMIEGQMKSIAMIIMKERMEYYYSNGTNLTQFAQIYEKVFYLQQLNNQAHILKKRVAEEILNYMLSYSQNIAFHREQIVIATVVLSFIGIIFGFGILLRMKRKYLQEVYFLSFLTESMIKKNKRIESYLNMLDKKQNT